jgi:hypothetical protein
VLILVAFISCQQKFDPVKWQTKEYPEAPPESRKSMLKDLLHNYRLEQLNESRITDLLGKPDWGDSNSITYKIVEDYGSDIDPVYTKNLDIEFNEDKSVKKVSVEEWKK